MEILTALLWAIFYIVIVLTVAYVLTRIVALLPLKGPAAQAKPIIDTIIWAIAALFCLAAVIGALTGTISFPDMLR